MSRYREMLRIQTILVGGAIVAAVFILLRIILGTPLVARVREEFTDAAAATVVPATMNTICPDGTAMVMWEGRAYCCGGRINSDTDRLEKVCTAGTSAPDAPKPTFCTLGAATPRIPNCFSR